VFDTQHVFVYVAKKKNMLSMKMKNSRGAGFTLVEIMIVVAIIGVLMAMAIPNLVNARRTAQTKACISNLQKIDGANQQYALENNLGTSDPAPSFDQIKKYLGRGSEGALVNTDIKCPGGGTYSQGATTSDPPTCSKAADGHVLNK
jgi:prepilin-type N-terminal cleavage/methylation domain-containing protein